MTQDPISGDVMPAMGAKSGGNGVLTFSQNQRGEVLENETAGTLKTGGRKPGQGYPAVRIDSQVRKLTPTECERLMGWPDGWTIPTRSLTADGTPPAGTASSPTSPSGSGDDLQMRKAA
jgi:DNA (cytosine-5)-methyltransferase 1